MTVIDMIMALSKMPPEMEIVYENTQPGDDGFRMTMVENIGILRTDQDIKYVLLNPTEGTWGGEL